MEVGCLSPNSPRPDKFDYCSLSANTDACVEHTSSDAAVTIAARRANHAGVSSCVYATKGTSAWMIQLLELLDLIIVQVALSPLVRIIHQDNAEGKFHTRKA